MKVQLAVMGIIVASLVLVGCGKQAGNTDVSDANTEPGPYAALAQCLTDNGVIMYGTERCSHCKNQKSLFGSDFANVNYVNCDEQRQVCMNNGVQGYPTWKDAEGNAFPGVQSLERLAEIGGCQATLQAPTQPVEG